MLDPRQPALVLAPMDGITDAPMRALQGEIGGFSYAVSEFIRVSQDPLPRKVFVRDVPELAEGARTPTGLPVQVQILGGDPELMARSAATACRAGATAVDINFGCPAPTVNRHDGGASLLRHPERLRRIVAAVRESVPAAIPVSAKLRLGWDDIGDIDENAEMAVDGGASWLTVHARTRVQGYSPPVSWPSIGRIRDRLGVPVVANGDIWNIDDFHRCVDETGCSHFMLGRGTLANPGLSNRIAFELGIGPQPEPTPDWQPLMERLLHWTTFYQSRVTARSLLRMKQWLSLASKFGDFPDFDRVKTCASVEEMMTALRSIAAAP